jgi:hypothetical protein
MPWMLCIRGIKILWLQGSICYLLASHWREGPAKRPSVTDGGTRNIGTVISFMSGLPLYLAGSPLLGSAPCWRGPGV